MAEPPETAKQVPSKMRRVVKHMGVAENRQQRGYFVYICAPHLLPSTDKLHVTFILRVTLHPLTTVIEGRTDSGNAQPKVVSRDGLVKRKQRRCFRASVREP